MIKHSLNFVILFFTFISCNTSVKEEGNIQILDLDMRKDSVLKVAEIKCIPLETREESLFHEMSKVICRNNKFYIFDRKGKSILIFDHHGSFMRKIHAAGSGPEEYVEPSDIDVDERGNIYVADNSTQRIVVFPESPNETISVIAIDRYFLEFVVADSDFIYLSDVVSDGEMNIKLAKYNRQSKKLDIIEESNLNNNGKVSRFAKHYFYRSNEMLYYYKRFSPYIYRISGDESIIDFKIKSKWFPTKDKVMEWETKGMQAVIEDAKYIRDISACYETNNDLFLVSQTTPSLYTVLNKKTGNIYNSFFFNDKRLDECIHVLSSDGKYYVSTCPSTSKTVSYILSENSSIDPICLKRIESLTEDSNPVLVLFRFD